MSKISFKQFNDLSKIDNPTEQQLDEIFGFGNPEKKAAALTALKKAEFEERKKKAQAQLELKKINDDEDGKIATDLQKKAAAMKMKLNNTPDDQLRAGQLRALDRNPYSFESKDEVSQEEVDEVLKKISEGDLELYSVMNHPHGPAEKKAAKWLQRQYDIIAGEKGYHADDDFEDIERELQREIEKKF